MHNMLARGRAYPFYKIKRERKGGRGEKCADERKVKEPAPRHPAHSQPPPHGGVLAAKVRDFGPNLLKRPRGQMMWAPNLLKSATWALAPSNVLKWVRLPDGGDSQKGLTRGAAAAPRVPRPGTRDVPGRHPRPAPGVPARHPGPAPGVPARHPGPAPEVPARHPSCRHHTERKLAGRVDSPSRAQIAPPRWLHTPVGVPWR